MDSTLKERKGHHKGEIQLILSHKELFVLLVAKYKVCMCCVYRTFMLVSPKIYTDQEFSQKLMAEVLMQLTNSQTVSERLQMMIKEHLGWLKENQKNQFCWLCSGILQTSYLNGLAQQIVKMIKEEDYEQKNKYKLNLRVHSIFTIKHQIFCHFLVKQLEQLTSREASLQIYKEVICPLFEKNSLELKTVFKWVLSHTLNELPAQFFTLSSTINEDEDTVILTIEIQHMCADLDNLVGGLLGPYLHFTTLKPKSNRNKKIKIDLENEQFHVKWTSNTIGKITSLQLKQWNEMSSKETSFIGRMVKIQEKSHSHTSHLLNLSCKNIYLCGKYVKYSRYLSQTPWMVNHKKLAESSLQEEIQNKIMKYFYPEHFKEEKIEVKFHAGGRQDIDVRMLKGGRPFVIEFVNPRITLKDMKMDLLLERVEELSKQKYKQLMELKESDIQEEQFKVKLLQVIVNTGNQLAQVYEFQKTTASYISNELKAAEGQKIKHYICFIKSEQPFSPQDKIQLEKHHNLQIIQKTPIRVLHRRTQMYRNKTIHKMQFHPTTKFGAVLEIWASAGTYIKEFVHGDLNRTKPNVGSLLNKPVDILQLDVGSLKEGEWEEGADKDMRVGTLPWQVNEKN